MSGPKYFGFDTLSLHAGAQPDPATGARATPIYQSTSFVFKDSDHAASLFNMERAGHVYSRISNPTVAVLEERIAALEGGAGGDCHGQRSGVSSQALRFANVRCFSKLLRSEWLDLPGVARIRSEWLQHPQPHPV